MVQKTKDKVFDRLEKIQKEIELAAQVKINEGLRKE